MTMEIVNVKINDLKFSEYNPRKADGKQVEDIKNSIREFGLVEPIVVNSASNRFNTIIGGHLRQRVAKTMGFKEMPVVYVSIPDIAKERELNLRLNKNLGQWDYDLLANFSEEELNKVGFESEELDKIFQLDAGEDDFDAEAELEKIKDCKVKTGDLYQLGEHRLLCGDSTKKEDVNTLMGGVLADMILTDPPYNTGMEGKQDKKARLSYMFKDNFSAEDYILLLQKSFKNSFDYSKGECAFYVFIGWRNVALIKQEMEILMDVKNVIVWDKVVHGLGSDYKSTYEMCVVGKKGKPKINNRYGLDYQDIWRVQRKMGRDIEHSTKKPLELLKKPILHASKQDDIVLDLFGGSGSTLIACEQLNRKCYMCEIDNRYCEIIINRWEKLTNKTAIKI